MATQSLSNVLAAISPKTRPLYRKTRNSVVPGELIAPYIVKLASWQHDGLIHSVGNVDGAIEWVSCCRERRAGLVAIQQRVPTCIACGMCMGCYTCMPGYITDETMLLGKWETKDGRKLYPFEMDNTHLMNAIAKLKRDKTHFKDDWGVWVTVLENEAHLRRLT